MKEEVSKGRAASEWVMAGVVILSCLHGEAARFSWLMMLFLPFLFWDLYQSRREGRPLWPRMTAEVKGMSRVILLFYGALLTSSLLRMDWDSADVAVRLARLALPFFMMVYIEGKYPGGRGFVWGIGASMLLLALTGLAYGLMEEFRRYQGIFSHPNTFGLVLSQVIPMGVYSAWQVRRTAIRMLLGAGVLLCLYCFYQTDSRASMGGLVVGTLLAAAIMLRMRRKTLPGRVKRWAAAAMAVILLVGGGMLWEMQSHRTGMGRFGYERIYMWEASYDMWRDHKLLGVGLANWKEAYYSPEYHPEDAKEQGPGTAHNMPVHFFSTTGTLGGGAFLFFLGYSFWMVRRRAEVSRDDALSMALFTLYFSFQLCGLFDSTYINKSGGLLYYTFLGYGFMAGRAEFRA